MIKDKFEIEIGKRLRETKAAVPAGSWAAIQSSLKTSPANLPPQNSVPFAPAGFVVGLVAGAAMLISLSVYTANETNQTFDKSIVEVSELQASQENPSVIVVQNPEKIDTAAADAEAPKAIDNQNQRSVNHAAVKDVKHNTIYQESTTIRNAITAKPIAKYDAREINAKHKNVGAKRKLAAKPQADVSKNVKSVSNVKAKISADKTTGYAPLTVHFDNNVKGQKYYWEFGFRAESYDKAPDVIFEEPGNYTIYLTVESANGQIDEDFIEIHVLEESSIFFPNAFTPNGDGHNDTYKVTSTENFKEFYMIITDQTGKTIFESRDINREWIFDHSAHGAVDAKYFLTYRAVGIGGKVFSGNQIPIHVLP